MRILAIGDIHGDREKVKDIPLDGIDLILLSGDIGGISLTRKKVMENIERQIIGLPKKQITEKEMEETYMESYDGTIDIVSHLAKQSPVFLIYGNLEISNRNIRKRLTNKGIILPSLHNDLKKIPYVKIINNKKVRFNGIKIGGLEYFLETHWLEEFKPKHYEDSRRRAEKETRKAEKILKRYSNIDILLCHQPPYGIHDKTFSKLVPEEWYGKSAGSKIILDYVKGSQPRYVLCGHIHESGGTDKIGMTEVTNMGLLGHKIIEL